MIILGIDPGLATVGIGIIEKLIAEKMRVLDWCTIDTSKALTLPQRLLEISDDLAEILREHKPALAVIEKLYFETNRKTAIDVAQARGVILHTVEEAGIPIIEPTPLELKSAVTGDGHADKKQMIAMMERILGEKCPSDDAADALGLAVYGALYRTEALVI
jgi:crossover junction endodeoxyribonuclease RuvC